MALKVEIYQKENVRPFSPTPQSLRNYKLSMFDQIAGTHYTPIFFFYNNSHHHDYDELKESLSKTLSVLYPLAGRVKDGSTIECNDKGADFVRAIVTNYDLSDFLQLRNLELLRQLLPRDPYPMDFDPSQPMLAVQVNRFRCSGTCVAICIWHGVADGAALVGFVQTWAAINRGEEPTNNGGCDLVMDATTIFPPIVNFDFSNSTSSFASSMKMTRGKFSAKRFVFSKREIERMRDEYTLPDNSRPSGVEALSAFLWAAVIRATQPTTQNLKMHMLTHVLDLRKRMNPSFPSTCLGNMIQVTAARWEANDGVTAQSLIGKVREAIAKVNYNYVRKMQAEGGFHKVLVAEMGKIARDLNAINVFGISSLGGFPFHELDFGWGMPIRYIAAPFTIRDSAYFSKTIDGGIEVLIGLTPHVMSNLDNDNQFHAYVSCSEIMAELSSFPSRL